MTDTAARPEIIVVGAGGAGAPLAARLAERGRRVLLLEAGPATVPEELRRVASLAAAVPGHPLAWSYPSELTAGRAHTVVRGRLAGGSTAVNAGYFRRARAHDLDGWATEAGDERWSAAAAAPVWARLERDTEFGEDPGHGVSGPMAVSRGDLGHPVNSALMAAGLALGLPLEADKNASPDAEPGVGPTPANVLDGERWSTARAYLEDAPAGLEVRGGHRVVQVVIEKGRAVGVRALVDDQLVTLQAELIVLSAGAIASAQLLMLSGVGPAEELRALGLRLVHDAPAVGARLDDHPNVALPYRVPRAVLETPALLPLGVSLHGSSGLAGSVPGDLEVLSFLQPLGRMLGTDPADETLSLLVSPLRGTARGRMSLASADPLAPPRLSFRYAENESDRASLRAAVRLGASALASTAMSELGARAEHPEPGLLDDGELDRWIRDRLSTALHGCSTTPMGRDAGTAVVDGTGAVHGVSGLHIADTGILPSAPTGGPAASAVLIGEIIADALS